MKSWRILTRLAFRIKSLWLRWLCSNGSNPSVLYNTRTFYSDVLETGSLLPRQQRFKAVNRLCLRWWWAHTHRCRQQHRREQRGVKDAAARDPFVSSRVTVSCSRRGINRKSARGWFRRWRCSRTRSWRRNLRSRRRNRGTTSRTLNMVTLQFPPVFVFLAFKHKQPHWCCTSGPQNRNKHSISFDKCTQ